MGNIIELDIVGGEDVSKYNPYHGPDGRFTGPGGATFFTWKPGSAANAKAIAREKERTGGGAAGKAVADVEARIRNLSYESAAVIGKDGKILVEKDGGENYVKFSLEELSMMNNAILTHNHPGGSCFSAEDIQVLEYHGLSEMRATTANNGTFSLKRMSEVERPAEQKEFYDLIGEKPGKRGDLAVDYHAERSKAQANTISEMDRWVPQAMARGEVTQQQANDMLTSGINDRVTKWLTDNAPYYGYQYSNEG